ncbi:SURF1 family protein [Mycetocola miduiensis]|uniref:SURF1-like protein n=1 Tax=Mycetocola miduiensis TaxID=995034 RepID=A0A1I5DQ54_9MICO|nr:SURF1 family protein [Mycetocola miduiensis]SFO01389.1 Cytochrome oxidase assembly protein ShyY1 [Mycetocola miduiensis]
MKNWRFVISRRWFGYLAVAVVFAVVCVLLSNWQVSRLEEKRLENSRVLQNYENAPIPLDEALATPESWEDNREWTPVSVTGSYLVDEQVLVRNRPRNGQPGFEVLTPLQLSNGSVFIVDRGWLPTGNAQDLPDVVPAPPTGDVTVTARLKPGEPALQGRSAAEGQMATVELAQFDDRLDAPVYTGAYGLMASETPAPAEDRPLPAFKPELDEGSHLSYALQWIVFGLLGFAFLGYAIREEYRHLNADDPAEQTRAAERERKRVAKRSDADVEDDILDASVR